MALFYLAIEILPLQDAVTLFFCSPVLATLFELIVTGESPGWAGAAATCCTVAGVALVAQPHWLFHLPGPHHHQFHPASPAGLFDTAGGSGMASAGLEVGTDRGGGAWLYRRLLDAAGATAGAAVGDGTGGSDGDVGGSGISVLGAIMATTAAATNAAAFVVVRLLRRSQTTLVMTWWYHAVVVVFAAVPLALRYPAPAVLPSRRGAALLGLVCCAQFTGQLLLNRGFQLESATRGSAINVLQVLFSFVWDIAVLGDTPGLLSIGGSALVAAGVVCVALTA
ncbi:hypothetical protein GPECTOR_41g680 [Gonium pectorale]|uniref:EamA domain-containing protein n=1 Tax=Gonium pectorale TaxID=33097 RepID=A0A150GA42_GONPE|nr:hypothetical protein GPECTOR_41g680 [Gonium pectorale]|eukprot:KXZ46716.1 hypothetical protein GPECTOR_41g680 [Gonium pectorale]